MATEGVPTEKHVVCDSDSLRIVEQDAQHWRIDWSFASGRSDLRGSGWVAVLIGYDPKSQHKFKREFVDKTVRLVPKSDQPIIIEYKNLYSGESKYAYDKSGGDSGMLVITASGTNEIIRAADAATMLMACQSAPKSLSLTPEEVALLRAKLAGCSEATSIIAKL
jgi:hypothetical protein